MTSPEAKQAAGKIAKLADAGPDEMPWYVPPKQIEPVVQEAIDAATAKLREANDNLFKVARKHSVENQKLKDDVSYWKGRGKIENEARQQVHAGQKYWEDRALEAEKQLAHQQPSNAHISAMQKAGYKFEPTDDGGACYPTKHGSWDTPKVRLVLDWQSYLQPSAPLITKESALAYFKQFLNGDKGMASAEVLADVMLTVQHQARVPLVAKTLDAIRYAAEELQRVAPMSHAITVLDVLRATLTGTGYCPCYSYMDGDTDPSCPMHGTHGKSALKPSAPKCTCVRMEFEGHKDGCPLAPTALRCQSVKKYRGEAVQCEGELGHNTSHYHLNMWWPNKEAKR